MYERLYSARMDLGQAMKFADFLLKKGWHFAPYERRGTIYCQQAAFVTAFIIAYGRAFTEARGRPSLRSLRNALTEPEKRFHDTLLSLRNQAYAHSDAAAVHLRTIPMDGGAPLVIEGLPFFRLRKFELEAALFVIAKLLRQIIEQMQRLGPAVSASPLPESVSPIWAELKDAAAAIRAPTAKGKH